MHIEIDQSGKIEQLNRNTVIAFSNKNQYSILIRQELPPKTGGMLGKPIYNRVVLDAPEDPILKNGRFSVPKSVKQEVYEEYKGKIKELRYRLFCVGIYYCIKDYIREKELITICCEYKGRENLIKSLLLYYLRKIAEIDPKIIRFGFISKKSNAHAVAIDVYRGHRKPNRTLSLKEVKRMLE